MKYLHLFCVPVAFLSACASIVEGDTQPIAVATSSCPQARCVLTNEQGVYNIGSTPSSVIVNKSRSPLSVMCSKNDANETILVESDTEAAAFGNIIAGGLIGAAVDMSTGAAYVYPSTVENPLKCG